MALAALFLALTGGSAYALTGSNTVFSDDIVNGQVMSEDVQDNGVRSVDVRDDTERGGGLAAADLGPGSVGTSEVADGSLTGADVEESSLGTVPAATIGGLGRSAVSHPDCAPAASGAQIDCVDVSITTQRTASLLATAAGRTGYFGQCRFAVVPGGIVGPEMQIGQNNPVGPATDFLRSAVLPSVPAGTRDIQLQCSRLDLAYPAVFNDMQLSVVALGN
jgi:hypothetical protein